VVSYHQFVPPISGVADLKSGHIPSPSSQIS